MTDNASKLAWLRAHPFWGMPPIPNIYALSGFKPNGYGPQSWAFGSITIPDAEMDAILGQWNPHELLAHLIFVNVENFEAPADRHDYRYEVGGDEGQRKDADLELRDGIERLVEMKWYEYLTDRKKAKLKAEIMLFAELCYFLVRKYGSQHFAYKSEP